jgi:hypothetical protein
LSFDFEIHFSFSLSSCRSGGGQASRGVILPIESAKKIKGAQLTPNHWVPKPINDGEKYLGRKVVDHSDSPNGLVDLLFSSMRLFDH